MTPLQIVLVYVAAPLLLLAAVGGSAWWFALRCEPPQFPVLRGGRPLPLGPPSAQPDVRVTEAADELSTSTSEETDSQRPDRGT